MRDGKKAETFDTCERIIKSSSRRQTAHILWWLKASQVLSSFDSHIVVPSLWLLSLEERKKKVNYTSSFFSEPAGRAGWRLFRPFGNVPPTHPRALLFL